MNIDISALKTEDSAKYLKLVKEQADTKTKMTSMIEDYKKFLAEQNNKFRRLPPRLMSWVRL